MENSIFIQAAKFLRDRRNNKRWQAIVFCMAVLAVGGTVWVLRNQGQAKTAPDDVLDCPLEVHKHDESCLDAEGNLICKEADFVFHTHNEDCYDEEGTLVCQLSEIEEHTHDESCFETKEVLVCAEEETTPSDEPASAETEQTEEEVLACTLEEHVHDDGCYEAGEPVLACGMTEEDEEEEHIHSDECYAEGEPALICGLEEHQHGPECYEVRTLEISQDEPEENVAHVHGEECYMTVRKLTCEEKGIHIHDSSCYDEGGVLICDASWVEQVEEHIHDEECFRANTEAEYTAVYEDEEMIVTAVYKRAAEIPEEAQLSVEKIIEEDDPERYEELLASLDDALVEAYAEALADEFLEDPLPEGLKPAMLLQAVFHTDDEIIIPQDNISLTVQFLDDSIYEEGDVFAAASFGEEEVELVSGTDIDEEGITTFEVEELSELAFMAVEKNEPGILTYEGEDYIVTVDLGEDAEIPEDAELVVESVTKESDAVHYEEKLVQLRGTEEELETGEIEDTEGTETAEGILGQEEAIALLLDMHIVTEEGEMALDGGANVTVQFLNNEIYFQGDEVKAAGFQADGPKLLAMADIDETNATNFETEELGEVAFIIADDIRTMIYEGDGFIVTVRFGKEAGIPENAELFAERITRESDPEYFDERERELWGEPVDWENLAVSGNELSQQIEEGAANPFVVIDALMKIGFYVNDREIEPEDEVEVKIQLLDRAELKAEEDDSRQMVHFAEDGAEVLKDAEIYEDEGNSLSTTFRTDSFSEYAVARSTSTVTTATQFHSAMQGAQDGDVIVIGKDITFAAPNFSYNRNTRPSSGKVSSSGGTYAGYYLGDNGDVILAKIQTPGLSLSEKKHITLDLNGYTLRMMGENMTLLDICWGAEVTIKDSWSDKSEEERAADPRPNVYSRPYDITISTPVDSLSGLTVENTERRNAVGGAIVGNGYKESYWSDDSGNANNQSSGGNRSSVITMWFGKLNLEGGIIAENANRAIRSRGGVVNLKGGYLLDNAAKEYYPRDNNNVYYDNKYPVWFGDYGEAIGGAVVCEELPGWKYGDNTWQNTSEIDEATGVTYRIPGEVNLSGTVLSGNRALQGGAISVTGCDFNITGGVVTHNRAYYRVWGGGGGGIKINAGTTQMTAGQVTANEVGGGGGGICIARAAYVELIGGFIAGNSTMTNTNGEGGGVALYQEWVNEFVDTKNLTVDKPPTDKDGYAVFEDLPSEGYNVMKPYGPTAIIGDRLGTTNGRGHELYITNNHSESITDWGGGGLFVSEGSNATIYFALITENSAKGFGGGLAGCSTGRILDFTNMYDGAAIFGNSASGDAYAGDTSAKHEDEEYTREKTNPAFWERGADGRYLFQDYFSALYSKMGNTMLGGGSENWDGSMDGYRLTEIETEIYKEYDSETGEVILAEPKWVASYIAGLTANPTEEAKAAAKQFTCAYITGNTSVTHGGGVMCNGIVSIGHGNLEITSAMKLMAKKGINDGSTTSTTGLKDGQFTFTVYAEDEGGGGKLGKVVSIGTNDAAGNIVFDRLLTFQLSQIKSGDAAWIHYYVVENETSDIAAGISTDSTAYIISICIQRVNKANPERAFCDITAINFEKGYIDSNNVYHMADTGSNIYVDSYNHGLLGDQKYHSEEHPLILDLTKGVYKYEYPEYKIVTQFKSNKTPAYTFTNTKENIRELKVTKVWDGWENENGMPTDVSSIKVYLCQDGSKTNKTLTLNAANGWTAIFTGLSGQHTYTIEEYVIYSGSNKEIEAEKNCEVEYEYTTTGTTANVKVTNAPKTYGIELTKYGEGGELLPGAQFEISRNQDGSDPLEFLQTNEGYVYCEDNSAGRHSSKLATTEDNREDSNSNGKLIVSGLPEGTYYLTETDAPIGYFPVEVHKITLGGGNEPSIECSKKSGCVVKTNGEDPDVLYINVTDEIERYSLPESGGFGTTYFNIMGVVLICSMAALMYMTYRRRKEGLSR